MCFYNSNSKRALDMAKRYGRKTDILEIMREIQEEQYRISAFTHPLCPIITINQSIDTAKWGIIPFWTKTIEDAKKVRKMTLNARAETVFQRPTFKKQILSKRCLIPSTGFFEFHHQGKTVIPYYIYVNDEDIFSLGGLYDIWQNTETKEIIQTFTIITVPANKLCSEIHNGGKNPFRMPLIISRKNEEMWLQNSLNEIEIKNLFHPFADNKMGAYPISKDFLKKSSNDKSIIEMAA